MLDVSSGKALRLVRGGPLFYALGRKGTAVMHDGSSGTVNLMRFQVGVEPQQEVLSLGFQYSFHLRVTAYWKS